MPYNVDKKHGGDSPENTTWMENCVKKVMSRKSQDGKSMTKSRAIAICKSTLQKSKSSEEAENKINFILDLFERTAHSDE